MELRQKLRRLLSPRFEGDDARAARVLHAATLMAMGLSLVLFVVTAVLQPQQGRMVAHGLGFGLALVAQWLLRAGRVRAASLLFVGALWGIATVFIALSGGPRSPAVAVYFPIVILASVVLGARGGISTAVVSSAALGAAHIMDRQDILPTALYPHTPPLAWLVGAASLLMAGGIALYATRLIDQSMQAARRSESTMAELVRSAPEGILALDAVGRIVRLNPAAVRIFGLEPDAAIGRPLVSLPWVDASSIARLLEPGPGDSSLRGLVGSLRRDDGDERELELLAHPIATDADDLEQPILRLSVRDVTERRRAERERDALSEQLHQAQRLESVGLLAGGIAHDFNNLTTVVVANVELLREDITEPRDREVLDEIATAAQRATELTKQLLAFSRRQVLEPRKLRLKDTIERMRHVVRRLVPESIELELGLEGAHVVRADPGQLTQVLVNLVVNARDAMRSGGRLRIETRDRHLEEPWQGVPAGDYSELVVRDSGEGMAPATLRRIFEPFFTTKGPGHGTGLGLAVVQGIVAQSGGFVRAESTVGSGSAFHVLFPRISGQPESEEPPTPAALRSTAGATILVAEDELPVRRVTQRILEGAGYEVLVAADGEAALAICRAQRGAVDVLLTDVVMPRMGGVELAKVARAEHPGLEVVFMSGYVADAFDGGGPDPAAFLPKPFTSAQLLAAVGDALRRVDERILTRAAGG